jgi:hypothetical protein
MGWPASPEQVIHEPNNLLIRLMNAYNLQQDWEPTNKKAITTFRHNRFDFRGVGRDRTADTRVFSFWENVVSNGAN